MTGAVVRAHRPFNDGLAIHRVGIAPVLDGSRNVGTALGSCWLITIAPALGQEQQHGSNHSKDKVTRLYLGFGRMAIHWNAHHEDAGAGRTVENSCFRA